MRSKAVEAVSDARAALEVLYMRRDNTWPPAIIEARTHEGGYHVMDENVAKELFRNGLLNVDCKKTEPNKEGLDAYTLRGVDRFGIADPWAQDVLRKLKDQATRSTTVPSGGTVEDHLIYFAVDQNGDGFVDVSEGAPVKVRAEAITWCAGADGDLGDCSTDKRGKTTVNGRTVSNSDNVYSWQGAQEVHLGSVTTAATASIRQPRERQILAMKQTLQNGIAAYKMRKDKWPGKLVDWARRRNLTRRLSVGSGLDELLEPGRTINDFPKIQLYFRARDKESGALLDLEIVDRRDSKCTRNFKARQAFVRQDGRDIVLDVRGLTVDPVDPKHPNVMTAETFRWRADNVLKVADANAETDEGVSEQKTGRHNENTHGYLSNSDYDSAMHELLRATSGKKKNSHVMDPVGLAVIPASETDGKLNCMDWRFVATRMEPDEMTVVYPKSEDGKAYRFVIEYNTESDEVSVMTQDEFKEKTRSDWTGSEVWR